MVHERSQTRKSAFYVIQFVLNSRKCKLIYNKKKRISVIAWGWRLGELYAGITNRHKVSLRMMDMLINLIVKWFLDGIMGTYIYSTYQMIHSIYVQFIINQLTSMKPLKSLKM